MRRIVNQWRLGSALVGLIAVFELTSCSSLDVAAKRDQVIAGQSITFMHGGFSAGPVLFTDGTGHLLEERRYEPFGAPIDARNHTNAGDVVGLPELVARDLNPLNKRTDVATGWSDHGARWMAPETGRWLAPDPPVKAPDAKLMAAPWDLNPYQYVDQNPIAFWDPDGREPKVAGACYVAGKEPTDGDGNSQGPYAYASATTTNGRRPGGVQAGIGMSSGKVREGVSGSYFHAFAGVARFTDSSHTVNFGVDLEAGVVHEANQVSSRLTVDYGILNAQIGGFGSTKDVFIGGEVNVADLALTYGSDSQSVRAGLSCGFGAGVRAHAGVGTNGQPYLGIGVDAAFLVGEEFDVKVETKTLTDTANLVYRAVGAPVLPAIGPPQPQAREQGDRGVTLPW